MTAPLWTAAQAAEATGGRNTADWAATGVSIDSRSLTHGDLFVALHGPNFDGHDFIPAAFDAGAAAAVSHRPPDEPDLADLPATAALLLVEDTLDALRALGRAARTRSAARFVGITGSAGKTSTKEALARCLATQGKTAASAGSFNNHWGLPLSLARMPTDAVYGVFELGMNHFGEIRALSTILRPQVAVITNIAPAHLGNFASLDEIAEAKAEIFEGMDPSGAAVLDRDSPFFAQLAEKARAAGVRRIVGFGRDDAAESRLVEIEEDATGSNVAAEVFGERIEFRVGAPGRHWIVNSLAVLAAVALVGAELAPAARELADLEPLPGRGRRRRIACPGGSFELIDDSYNANPASMRAAIQVLGRAEPGAGGRRMAVLGDMLELGASAQAMHRELAEPLAEAGVDLVFCSGPEMAALFEALPAARRGVHAAESDVLAPQVADAVQDGDVVLVKGSLGSRMARVVAALESLGDSRPQASDGA